MAEQSITHAQTAETHHFVPMAPIAVEDYWREPPAYMLEGALDAKKRLLRAFPNESVQVGIHQFESDGKVTFSVGTTSVRGGVYRVVVDYVRYRTDDVGNMIVQSGMGVRMTADVRTYAANLNVSSLFSLGMAAETNDLSGTLRFETMGISGKQISALLPLPSELSSTSVQNAMQAAAAIKASLYDDETELAPQVFGVSSNVNAAKHRPSTASTSTPREKGPMTMHVIEPSESFVGESP